MSNIRNSRRAYSVVMDYLFALKEPTVMSTKETIETYSYSRWAGDEIIRMLIDNPEESPYVIVRHFVLMLADFSEYNSNTYRIFAIAKAFSENILEVIKDIE